VLESSNASCGDPGYSVTGLPEKGSLDQTGSAINLRPIPIPNGRRRGQINLTPNPMPTLGRGADRHKDRRGVGARYLSLMWFAVGMSLTLAVLAGMRPTLAAAQAQGSEVQRFQQVAGPYKISAAVVQSGLSLGVTLFAITVVDEATGLPIPDVRVTLLTKHDESGQVGKGTAHNTPGNPDRYDAQMDLDTAGLWRVTVDVESSKGKVAVEMMQLVVPATRRITSGTFVFIGVFVVIIAGAAYLWWSTQRHRSSSSGTGANPT